MKKLDKSVGLPVLTLALGIFLVSTRFAFAVHLIRFSISIDGKAVLETSTSDGEDADALWRHLKQLQLRPVKGYNVQPDDDPLKATLKGKVVIQAAEGGRAEVAELKLVRESEDAAWKIAPGEVEPTLKRRHKPIIFVVSINGKTELSSGLQVRTGPTADDPDNVWRHWKQVTIVPISRYKVVADRHDPLHATLKGEVVLEVNYGGESWGLAGVSELKLVREKANARWKVDPEEVERTFKSRKRRE
jgi:hypothetical protein